MTFLITIAMLVTRRDIAYALVIIWALVGIGLNHSDQTVVMVTEGAAILVAVALVITVLVSRFRKKKAPAAST